MYRSIEQAGIDKIWEKLNKVTGQLAILEQGQKDQGTKFHDRLLLLEDPTQSTWKRETVPTEIYEQMQPKPDLYNKIHETITSYMYPNEVGGFSTNNLDQCVKALMELLQ